MTAKIYQLHNHGAVSRTNMVRFQKLFRVPMGEWVRVCRFVRRTDAQLHAASLFSLAQKRQ